VLSRAGVVVTPSSFEPDVKGIVTKITSGEADAGIVYSTDVVAAGDRASGVVIPMKQNVMASYPIARLYRARHNTTAAAWIDFINGAEGQTILTRFGFIAP
jgi:molybdate transport system substrate-binding protein